MSYVDDVLEQLARRNPGEPEFHQAAHEIFDSLRPVMDRYKKYQKNRILERISEPERTILFRVPWTDDQGEIHVNKGYRVEFNSAIGPYKGGLRSPPHRLPRACSSSSVSSRSSKTR